MSYEQGYINYIQMWESTGDDPAGGEEIPSEELPNDGTLSAIVPSAAEITIEIGPIDLSGTSVLTILISVPLPSISIEASEPVLSGANVSLSPSAPAISINSNASVAFSPKISSVPDIAIAVPTVKVGFSPVNVPANIEIAGIAPSISGANVLLLHSPPDVALAGTTRPPKTGPAPIIIYGDRIVVVVPDISVSSTSLLFTAGDIISNVPPNISISSINISSSGDMIPLSVSDGIFMWDSADTNWLRTVSETLSVIDTSTIQLKVLITEYLSLRETLLDNISCSHSINDYLVAADTLSFARVENILESLNMIDSTSVNLALFITEYLTFKESILSKCGFYIGVSEDLAAIDLIAFSIIERLSETLNAEDAVALKLKILVHDYLAVRDAVTCIISMQQSVSETMALAEVLTFGLVETITDSLSATDSVSGRLVLLVTEYLVFRDSIVSLGVYSETINEGLALTDSIVSAIIETISESLSVEDAITLILSLNVSDILTLADTLSATCVFNEDLTEYLTAVDAVSQANLLSISDTVEIADAVSNLLTSALTLSESVLIIDAVTPTCSVVLTVNESLILYESVAATGHFYLSITEGMKLNVTIIIGDEVYDCFVLNTPKFLPSVYSGFNFNSYCEYQGRAFGANSEGLFELTGETDNGDTIHTGAQFHETDFGMRNQKRFRKAYIGISGASPVMVMETDDGERKAYTINNKGKVDASRSIHGKEWTLSVADFDTLENIYLVPVILSRGK